MSYYSHPQYLWPHSSDSIIDLNMAKLVSYCTIIAEHYKVKDEGNDIK